MQGVRSDDTALQLEATTHPPIDEVIKAGAVPWFFEFLGRHDLPQLQVNPALPILKHLFYLNDEEILTDACWVLSDLSDGSNEKIQRRINCLALLHNKSVLNKWNIIHKTYSPRTSYVGSVAGDKPQFHSVTETAARKSILQDFSSDMKSGSSSTES
ncbi:importin subunit alpha-like [Pyrus ussuriensis x Pyrus communis]|uniref:Importin subunit alpha-like n=1 Tax=Pyrus ussuriensis x Pyrus communis TaxID=2448454 RepID=A0A5N5HR31_9ROSA|nr:importin subunit alpha-like [Pyrus ussuriensis x Pyrus communis]